MTQRPTPFRVGAGDPQPEDRIEFGADFDEVSVFERLVELLPTETLTRSYRAGGEDLAELVNTAFYGGRLVSLPWAGSYLGRGSLSVDYVEDGTSAPVPLATWLGPLTHVDHAVLDRAAAPVLDVGCGPGRHVVALARRGVFAAGVDASPVAVEVARARGARVFHASVFAAVPGTGTWGTALLLDGNIGIGGRPARLLARLRTLLRPGGEILVELDAPGGVSRSATVRLEADGAASDWFPWARVAACGIDRHARAAELDVAELWEGDGRWFARLVAAR